MDYISDYLGEAMNVDEITLMARKAGFVGFDGKNKSLCKFAALVEEAARADERDFIATKWENLYGYDKQGVAEFIRKRANTQEETT